MKYLAVLLILITKTGYSQVPLPAAQAEPTVLMGGTIHIGNGQVIENGVIHFSNGKIVAVSSLNAFKMPDSVKTIDAIGKHIYPGLIIPNSTLGLNEIFAVRATQDYAEVGFFNPNVRSIIAYNTDSRIIPTIRSNGVLLAQSTPMSGIISGTSSVVELEGWNWEDAVYKMDDGIHLNWPRMFFHFGGHDEAQVKKRNELRLQQLKELEDFLADAKAYQSLKNPAQANLKLEAMRGVFDGSKTLYIHADYGKEIVEAISFIKQYDIKRPVIVGGLDSWMFTDFLKENNVPVILSRIHALPNRADDDIELPFKLPAMLQKAGVLFCLSYEGDMEAMGGRNLPFIAGTAAAYGLTREEAISAITLNTAKILGIDKTVGSLEIGKDATLFISTGDALEMKTHNVEYAFIRGRQLDLNDVQKELYRKYKRKYQSK